MSATDRAVARLARPGRRALAGAVGLAAATLASGCGGSVGEEPENGLIAYITPSGSTYSAFVVEPDGSDRRPLTSSGLNEECVRWSPDGTRLALVAYDAAGGIVTESWIEVVTADGELDWRISAAPTRCPAWSPDGSRIAFVTGSALSVVDADGAGTRRLAQDVAPLRDPAWSPDGDELAYVPTGHDDGRAGSLAVTIAGTASDDKRIVPVSGLGGCAAGETLGDRAYRFGNDTVLAWAPGDEIVYALEGNAAGCGGLYAVGPDGSDGHRVNPDSEPAAFPTTSPDASRVAFSGSSGAGGGAIDDIWTVMTDGTDAATLTGGAARDYLPVWSPDGGMVAYLSSDASGADALYVVPSEGGAPQLLEADVSQSGPSWQSLP